MITKFAKKLVMGFILWMAYSLELFWTLVMFDQWLDLSWVTLTYEGNQFLNGIGWLIGFIVLTAFTTFVTVLIVNEPE